MSLDAFTPRVLTANVRNMGNAQELLLQNRLFRPSGIVRSSGKIDFGKLSANIKAALYRKTGEGALAVESLEGTLNSVDAPKIRLKVVYDENKASTLNPGLQSYAGPYTDPQTQLAEKIAEDQLNLRRMAERAMELQCAQALELGTVTITYEQGDTATVSFGYTGNGSLSGDSYTIQPDLAGTDLWTDAASDPLKTLRTLGRQVRAYSDYGGALDVYMGSSAATAFLANTKAQAILDKRNIVPGQVRPVDGTAYLGSFGGFNLFEYVFDYETAAAARTAGFTATKIAVVPALPQDWFSIEYAAVYDFVEGSQQASWIPTDWFSKMHAEGDPPVNELIVECRPLAIIKKPEAVRIQKVVTA